MRGYHDNHLFTCWKVLLNIQYSRNYAISSLNMDSMLSIYLHIQVDFEITSAIPSLSRSLGGGGGGRDLYSEEDYSDFSDLSEGEQEQEPVTVAKIKHQHTEKG